MKKVAPDPPCCLGDLDPHDPELEAGVDQLAGDLRLLVHLAHEGPDPLLGEVAHDLAEGLLVVGEVGERQAAQVLGHRSSSAVHASAVQLLLAPSARFRGRLDTPGRGLSFGICHVEGARRATRGPRQARPVRPAGGVPGPGLGRSRTDSRDPPGDPGGFSFWRRGESLSARVGVFGATGYTGRELVRLLRRHPRARVAFTTGSEGGHLAHEAGLEQAADAYFLALPHGVAATYAARLREARPQAVVVDLSGDLRLPTAEAYKQWYGHEHPAPAPHRPGGLRPVRGLPRPAPRRAARVEPGLLRHLGAAAARPAPPRAARRRGRHRRRRQERRDRGRPHARARTCSSARSRRTSPPTRRAARTATSARSRPCWPSAPARRWS